MNISMIRIKSDLAAIGLKKGDSVIVHSSFSSMGNVVGGAETVMRAILDVIGEEGTLMFPTFTHREVYESGRFDYKNSPSCVGYLSEYFRNMPGVVRSMHPTHSVAAIGRLANEFIKDHEKDRTPMGEGSPYRRLAKYNAKILMLGCPLDTFSYLHALEEEFGTEYSLRNTTVDYTVLNGDEKEMTDGYFRYNFVRPEGKIKQCYSRILDVLTSGKEYTVTKIHGALSYLIDAAKARETILEKLREDEYYFVDPSEIDSLRCKIKEPQPEEKCGYDIIVLAGQSNAVGFGWGPSKEVYQPNDRILEFSDDYKMRYIHDVPGVSGLDYIYPPHLYFGVARDKYDYERANGCLANSFAAEYLKRGYLKEGRKLVIVKAAIGGTGFIKGYWAEDGICVKRLYYMMDKAFSLGEDCRIVAFLWHQGEHDVVERPEWSLEYRKQHHEKKLGTLLCNFVKKYEEQKFPIIAGEFTEEWTAKNKDTCNAILSATENVLNSIGRCAIVSSAGLDSNGRKNGVTDILHFSYEAQMEFGKRYFEAWEKLIKD